MLSEKETRAEDEKKKLASPSRAFLIQVRGIYLVGKPKHEDLMIHVLPTRTSLRKGGHKTFISPRAYIEGENSEFFQVPGLLYREKAMYDDLRLASLSSSLF